MYSCLKHLISNTAVALKFFGYIVLKMIMQYCKLQFTYVEVVHVHADVHIIWYVHVLILYMHPISYGVYYTLQTLLK